MQLELKKQLNKFSAFIRWLPLALPYWTACHAGAPRRIQVQLMPPPRVPLIFWVTLTSITLETTQKNKSSGISFVRRGEWDRENVRERCTMDGAWHEKSPYRADFSTVRKLCLENLPLEQIDEYRTIMAAFEAGKNPRGCKTRSDVRDYFSAMKKANLSIATEGYKTSASLGGLVRDEISIWVTREGQMVYGGWANHRLAMADLNKIERVPVCILGAHPDWLIEQCRLHSLPPHRALQRWISKLQ